MATYVTKTWSDQHAGTRGDDGVSAAPDKTVAVQPQYLGAGLYAATGFYDGDLASGDDINLFRLPENAWPVAFAVYTTGTTTAGLNFHIGDAEDDDRYLAGVGKTAAGGAMYMPLVYGRCGSNRTIKMKWQGGNPAADWTYLVTCFYVLGE